LPVCGNILNREFRAAGPGEKRVQDITYLRAPDGWVYLTSVMDLHDRKVIVRALSGDMTVEHTAIPALAIDCMNRLPKAHLIFHSGGGVQYRAASFREKLRELCLAVCQSMSRKGNCWDNVCAESFFKTLKRELETLDGRHSAAEVRQPVFMYYVH
jgi:transposase InsO family protein